MKKILVAIGFCCSLLLAGAQVPCDSIGSTFRQWDAQLDKLNYEDPEIITLHFYFLQDVRKEMTRFQNTTLPHLVQCLQTDYYQTKSQYNRVLNKANRLQDVLTARKDEVDQLFYERALEALAFQDTANCYYNLDRSLQFNPVNPNSLLLKTQLSLAQNKYQESVDLIHLIYTKATLDDEQEKNVSDFTIQLYDKLYNTGDRLAKEGHSADALEIFLALEQFCSNMPSGYCNEDYYKGILRSREGVYESYIAIAKEAEKRHNTEMAKKFYRYADEYRKTKQ